MSISELNANPLIGGSKRLEIIICDLILMWTIGMQQV